MLFYNPNYQHKKMNLQHKMLVNTCSFDILPV